MIMIIKKIYYSSISSDNNMKTRSSSKEEEAAEESTIIAFFSRPMFDLLLCGQKTCYHVLRCVVLWILNVLLSYFVNKTKTVLHRVRDGVLFCGHRTCYCLVSSTRHRTCYTE